MDPKDADRYHAPAAAVTYQKQEHLLRAAKRYISQNHVTAQPRMDVIEVYLAPEQALTAWNRFTERIGAFFGPPARKALKIHHIENAFGAGGRRI